MADVSLVFQAAAGGADLVFGQGAGPMPPAEAVLDGLLPALQFTARVIPNADLALVAVLPELEMVGQAQYQSYAVRPVTGLAAALWQPATAFMAGVQDRSHVTGHEPVGMGAGWARASAVAVGAEVRAAAAVGRPVASGGLVHQGGEPRPADAASSRYGDALRLRMDRRSGQAQAARAGWARHEVRHQDTLRERRQGVVSGYTQAQRHAGVVRRRGIRNAAGLFAAWAAFHQGAVVPRPGPRAVDPVTPPDPLPCYTPSAALRFAEPATVHGGLVFVCENHAGPPSGHEPVVVPVRRVYVVVNEVSLRRVVDGAEVPVFSLSLSLDAASWAWGFDAVLPAAALALVEPGSDTAGPVELLADVNGTAFRVLAEDVRRERSFAQESIRVSGRGRNAVLAAPYAPVMSFSNGQARTARQLMDDVLTHNGTATGVPLGWTVDWGLTDWNVPAGVFNHQGTWIEALAAIAGAAGGDLVPHPSALVLKVRHRYPVAPWAWDTVTPDVVLPADAVARESLRWVAKPAYNRVFVSGQEVGVLGQVTRAGTAGDVLAPMVVDALVTEAAAARQRGLAVLADTGRQVEVDLRLPLLAETGIIEPGRFVQYLDGSPGRGVSRLGLVRSTRVEAGLPEVWQTLGVQTYA